MPSSSTERNSSRRIDPKSFLPPPGPPPVRLSCSNFRSSWNEREWRETSARLSRRDDFLPENGKAIFPIKERRFLPTTFLIFFSLCSFRHILIPMSGDFTSYWLLKMPRNRRSLLVCCCAGKMNETLYGICQTEFFGCEEQLSEISGIDQKSFHPPLRPPPIRLSCSNFRSFWNEREWERDKRTSRTPGMTFYRKNGKAIFPDKRATTFADDISHFFFSLLSYSNIDERRFHVVLVAQNANRPDSVKNKKIHPYRKPILKKENICATTLRSRVFIYVSSRTFPELSEISGIDQKSFLPPSWTPLPLFACRAVIFEAFGTKENGERQAHVSHAGMTFTGKTERPFFPLKRATIFANDTSHFLLPFCPPVIFRYRRAAISRRIGCSKCKAEIDVPSQLLPCWKNE
ncbi:hypothetical protein CEXT_269131 [Caerostris extrusa]|uniref:Uncharacterized protein n=1 Tax=Caerostris extrusa TaxID=172846 RepID=A0AAV4R4T9_CAEEX|nr:hypothetical protein CEXT_269131 [Caerostris extrusa]